MARPYGSTDTLPHTVGSSPADGYGDEPVYFQSNGRTLFGWLHRPVQSAATDTGAVLCKPFGYESLCGHRALRTMADTATHSGVPTLRFDYAGCGDSEDLEAGSDQIEVWTQDVLAAVEELRRRTGVSRICLIGVRLGALLATLAASRSGGIHGLYLFAPVVSGKRYLRELKAAQLSTGGGPELQDSPSGEFGGYPLFAPTLARMEAIDLTRFGTLPKVADIFIADRNDLPGAEKWGVQLAEAGIATTYEQLPGFFEMALVAPHEAIVPTEVLRSLREWLARQTPDSGIQGTVETGSEATRQIYIGPDTSLVLPGAQGDSAQPVRERPVAIQSGASIFGILTEPGIGERRRRSVILLNTGTDSHMGVSRTYVMLARSWARRGYHVLRMDLTGIGDSGAAPGQALDVVYSPTALDDVRAAVEFMRSQVGSNTITLAGVCSGAYHSLRAAAASLPVNQILMINPLTYFWEHGATLDQLQSAEIVRNPGLYVERMGSAKAWKRVLSGKVDLRRIFKIYLHRPMLSLHSKARDLARSLGIRLARDLGRELQEMSARGVRIVFVFAEGEPGRELLEIEAGSALRRLGKRCHIRIIDEGDHTFTQKSAGIKLSRVLNEELFSRPSLEHLSNP